jgi:hypothetical protein
LRIVVKDADEAKVGRAFSDRLQALALASYAGFHTTTPPTAAGAYGIYWPTTVPPEVVTQTVHLPDGSAVVVSHTPGALPSTATGAVPEAPGFSAPSAGPGAGGDTAVEVPLGRLFGARSGDKGGNANVGVWARDDRAYGWLRHELTTQRFRELIPEASDLDVRRYELPNLRAVNFVVEGIIAPGVAATTRPDAQAKGLGEQLRAQRVAVPSLLLER